MRLNRLLERILTTGQTAAVSCLGVLIMVAAPNALLRGAAATTSPAATSRPARMAVPQPAARLAAIEQIRAHFKSDYDRDDAAARNHLSQKLLGLAADERTNPAERFALLVEARDLALAGHDLSSALAAIRAAEDSFELSPAERLQAQTLVADTAESQSNRQIAHPLAARWIDLCDDATAAGDLTTATSAANRASAAAHRIGDTVLSLRADALTARMNDMADQTATAAVAQKTLAEHPDDPEANLALGKYLCSVKADWTSGLAALVKGSDRALKSAAGKDLAAPATGDGWVDAGNSWVAAAARERKAPAVQYACRMRARTCFKSALPLLGPADKPAVLKRLADLPGNRQELGPPGVDFNKLALTAVRPHKVPALGGTGGGTFEEIPAAHGPALLVGFRYSTGWWKQHKNVQSLCPIYLTAQGKIEGQLSGKPEGDEETIEAPAGYAIGAILVKATGRVQGIKLVFMRIHGAELDQEDSTETAWLGMVQSAPIDKLGGDGRPVVGIHGRRGHGIDALGIVQSE